MKLRIDMLLRRKYSNNPVQLGFQKGKSTEGAILRATELQHRGQNCIAVLDLSAAYDTVPRDFLIQRMRSVLPPVVCRMAEALLRPSWISTIRDPGRWFVIDKGVPQGSPLSPSLYNLFMDEFADRICAVSGDIADIPAVLFADDVLLTAKSPEGLQTLLVIATKWGEDRQRRGTQKAGKSEIQVSKETKDESRTPRWWTE